MDDLPRDRPPAERARGRFHVYRERLPELALQPGPPVVDLFGTTLFPPRLWLYTNFHCNLSCSYCVVASSPAARKRELDLDRVRVVLDDALDEGFEELYITGGEPFVHPGITAIIEAACDRFPAVVVLTNAMLFHGRRGEELARLARRPNLVLQTSLDSATPDVHDRWRGEGSWKRALEGLRRAGALGLPVRVAMTETPDGAGGADALRELLGDVAEVAVRPLVARGLADDGIEVGQDTTVPELTVTADGVHWHPLGGDREASPDFLLAAGEIPIGDAKRLVVQRFLELRQADGTFPRRSPARFDRGRSSRRSTRPVQIGALLDVTGIDQVIWSTAARATTPLAIARGHPAAPPRAGGRAAAARRSCNAGAAAPDGDVLVFLHADSRLPPRRARCARRALTRPSSVATSPCASTATTASRAILGRVYAVQRRARPLLRRQLRLVPRAAFHELGGYRELPIMDDYDFIRRMERLGTTVCLPGPAVTSARRWRAIGHPADRVHAGSRSAGCMSPGSLRPVLPASTGSTLSRCCNGCGISSGDAPASRPTSRRHCAPAGTNCRRTSGPRTQMLGSRTAGCEGTHGVFPRCDLACTPVLPRPARPTRVRIDGDHTAVETSMRQMELLRERRGPGPERSADRRRGHAARPGGARPSTAGDGAPPAQADVDVATATSTTTTSWRSVEAGGFKHLSFAGHFDSLMLGRRGLPRPRDEAELHPFRQALLRCIQRLEREHGVTHYLAHNMTVTPRNVGQVAEVVRAARDMGFRMFSVPAGRLHRATRALAGGPAGDHAETTSGRRSSAAPAHGCTGARLQIGDQRCNRTAYGGWVGDRYVPMLDEDDPRDRRLLSDFHRRVRRHGLRRTPAPAAARLLRAVARHPGCAAGAAWRARGSPPRPRAAHPRHLRHALVHGRGGRDAGLGAHAGRHRGRGPGAAEAWERLQACAYAMAHPRAASSCRRARSTPCWIPSRRRASRASSRWRSACRPTDEAHPRGRPRGRRAGGLRRPARRQAGAERGRPAGHAA